MMGALIVIIHALLIVSNVLKEYVNNVMNYKDGT
jgi:hypothetical protein